MTGLKQPLKRMATWAIVLGGTALAVSGLAAYGQNAVGSPINGFDPRTYDLAHSGDRSGGNSSGSADAYFKGFNGTTAEARNKTPPNPIVVPAKAPDGVEQKYWDLARNDLGIDSNGDFRNPSVKDVVKSIIDKFYKPNSYQTLGAYFDELSPKKQNVFFATTSILMDKPIHQSADDKTFAAKLVAEYADFALHAKGSPSFAAHYRSIIPTLQPSGNPAKEKYRQFAGIMVHVAYAPNRQLALVQ